MCLFRGVHGSISVIMPENSTSFRPLNRYGSKQNSSSMPLTHTRNFRVRYYECDAYGHLNNANYLRYMQETAFDASAAGGYGMQRYEEMKRYWLIRESQVEFLLPLRYDDQVNVTTWIADFRRVSSRRAYEFRLSDSGELAARAFTDWVFLDTMANRPASIPARLAKDFYPEGVPRSFPPRQPFQAAPPAPPGVFRTRRRVAWQDIDAMQHVNNAVYMTYASDCGFDVIACFGWPWQRMAEADFGVFLRHLHIQYLLPALLDDELEITTWAFDVHRSTATRHYAIRRLSDNALLAQVNILAVWVNLESGQPMRIPKQMLDDFASNIVGAQGANGS
jgi:acyl-CoA thioester hydrolase